MNKYYTSIIVTFRIVVSIIANKVILIIISTGVQIAAVRIYTWMPSAIFMTNAFNTVDDIYQTQAAVSWTD